MKYYINYSKHEGHMKGTELQWSQTQGRSQAQQGVVNTSGTHQSISKFVKVLHSDLSH